MYWQVPTERLELIDGTDATLRILVPNALGALVRHNVARVKPAKLVRGLAEVVERRGVSIYEQTAVSCIAKREVTTGRAISRIYSF